MATMAPALNHILRWEGGLSDEAHDKGGRTKYGVTVKALATARKRRPKAGYPETVDGLTREQAEEIFTLDYTPTGWLDIASQGIATAYLDVSVNSGPARASTLMQRALCAIGHQVDVDGEFGPQTLAAINASDPHQLMAAFVQQRKTFVQAIVAKDPDQKKFLGGWINRINDVPELA